ncbi:MAG: HAD family phosphatase [Proteobacteria bacterium]|nr:HAD family phosphatase [Pseudomonadota bacterium]
MIKVFLFDFGGVIAEEGFKNGLYVIAKRNFIDQEDFYQRAKELIYQTGYVEGKTKELDYFNELKKLYNLSDTLEEFRETILSKFEIRDYIIEWVMKLREKGFKTGILSDQTNWLYEINERNTFFIFFDYIFNSYRLNKTKRDPSVFSDVINNLKVNADEVVFIDDDPENVKRAKSFGIRVIQYVDYDDFVKRIRFFSGINSL